MKRRTLAGILTLLAVAALLLQTHRALSHIQASKILLRAEQETLASSSSGHLDPLVLRSNLARLRRAAEQDPVEVRIPIAIGTMHLLLRNPNEAVHAYRRALEVEERYEIYQNLAEAQRRAGNLKGAQRSHEKALKLAPFLTTPAGQSAR